MCVCVGGGDGGNGGLVQARHRHIQASTHLYIYTYAHAHAPAVARKERLACGELGESTACGPHVLCAVVAPVCEQYLRGSIPVRSGGGGESVG